MWILASRVGSAYRMARGDMWLVDSAPAFDMVLNKLAELLADLGQALLPTKKEARKLASCRPEVRELINLLGLLACRGVGGSMDNEEVKQSDEVKRTR